MKKWFKEWVWDIAAEAVERFFYLLKQKWFWLGVIPVLIVFASVMTYLEYNGYIPNHHDRNKAKQTQSQE